MKTYFSNVCDVTRFKELAFYELVVFGVLTGAFPMIHYYSFNLSLANSISQFFYFLWLFVVVPTFFYGVLFFFTRRFNFSSVWDQKLVSYTNCLFFTTFVMLGLFRMNALRFFVIIVVAIPVSYLMHKHIQKVFFFQFLLVFIGLLNFLPKLHSKVTEDYSWRELPDAIEAVKFEKSPNIYVFQVDGYANFAELQNDIYNFDNDDFKKKLETRGFKIYEDYRSNYRSTLSSNASLFSMKHHYYGNPKEPYDELIKCRKIVVSDNPVLNIFKNNDYKTHLILETPYFLMNRESIGFDYCNYAYSEVPFIDGGLSGQKDVFEDLHQVLISNQNTSANFYFIQRLLPSHITYQKNDETNKETEREHYFERLMLANRYIEEMIGLVEKYDKKGIIVFSADHGGYVGFDAMLEASIRQTDRNLIYSIFTSLLAIKWPFEHNFDKELKTPVNFFRVLFSSLSGDAKYLKFLEKDESYIIIDREAPFGVYKYIDSNGGVVFEKQ